MQRLLLTLRVAGCGFLGTSFVLRLDGRLVIAVATLLIADAAVLLFRTVPHNHGGS